MDKDLEHNVLVCISNTPSYQSDAMGPPPKVRVGFAPGEIGAIDAALDLKKEHEEYVRISALCIGDESERNNLEFLLALGFDDATVVLREQPDAIEVVESIASLAASKRPSAIFLGEYGYEESQLVPLLLASTLDKFDSVFGIDAVAFDQKQLLTAHGTIGTKEFTTSYSSQLICSFRSNKFLTHRVTLQAAREVAQGLKSVHIQTPMRVSEASGKLRATTPPRRSRQPYRPPARGVIPPPSPDLYSKIAKMQGIESSGMSAHRASETVTLDPSDAAREIVELLRAWGVEI